MWVCVGLSSSTKWDFGVLAGRTKEVICGSRWVDSQRMDSSQGNKMKLWRLSLERV